MIRPTDGTSVEGVRPTDGASAGGVIRPTKGVCGGVRPTDGASVGGVIRPTKGVDRGVRSTDGVSTGSAMTYGRGVGGMRRWDEPSENIHLLKFKVIFIFIVRLRVFVSVPSDPCRLRSSLSSFDSALSSPSPRVVVFVSSDRPCRRPIALPSPSRSE